MLADLPGGDDLRDVEGVELGAGGPGLLGRVDVGQGGVGGAEVDSDEVAGHGVSRWPGVRGPGILFRMTILGLDIGGANLKAATPDKRAVSVPFALWKQ